MDVTKANELIDGLLSAVMSLRHFPEKLKRLRAKIDEAEKQATVIHAQVKRALDELAQARDEMLDEINCKTDEPENAEPGCPKCGGHVAYDGEHCPECADGM